MLTDLRSVSSLVVNGASQHGQPISCADIDGWSWLPGLSLFLGSILAVFEVVHVAVLTAVSFNAVIAVRASRSGASARVAIVHSGVIV